MIFHVLPVGEGNPHKASFYYDDFGSGENVCGSALFVPPIQLGAEIIKQVKEDVNLILIPVISTDGGTIVDFEVPLVNDLLSSEDGEAIHKLVIEGMGSILTAAGKATNPAIFEQHARKSSEDNLENSVPEHLEDEFPIVAEISYSAHGQRLSEVLIPSQTLSRDA